jgi:hypothetical protein
MIPTLISFILITALPNSSLSIRVSLGETIPSALTNHLQPSTQALIGTIDTRILGQQSFMIDDGDNTITIEVTNDGAVVTPLIGVTPFISQVSWQAHDTFIELFNPSLNTFNLLDYVIQLNQTHRYSFVDSTILLPQTVLWLRIVTNGMNSPMIEGPQLTTELKTLTYVQLLDGPSDTILDDIPITSIIGTRFGDMTWEQGSIKRWHKTIGPSPIYNPDSWIGVDNVTPYTPFELLTPRISPLEQAKAWATYVMFGAGMNAAGRVEEAFRAIESEYEYMHPLSRSVLFNEPRTAIQGINERGQLATSSFREAIGRYNYLAARVPGATGITTPPTNNIPWFEVSLVGLAVIAYASVIIIRKTRFRKVSN